MNEDSPNIDIAVKPTTKEKTQTRRIPPYNVIIENDDHHSCEWVVEVLLKVLRCTPERAITLMMQAHNSGRAVIWTGTKEGAELKFEQLLSCHEIRDPGGRDMGPLSACIEPAEG